MTHKLGFNLLCFLLFLFANAVSARTFSYIETYTPANFYTPASSDSLNRIKVISDGNDKKGIYVVGAGQALKIKLIIPPAVEQFSAAIQVAKWKASATAGGEFLYAKSLTDFSDVESYQATFSTSFPFQFVNTAFADSDTPLVTVSNQVTEQQMTAYMIFDNTTSIDNIIIKSLSIQFQVNQDSLNEYNHWVETVGKNLPILVNLDGGGTSSSSSSSSTGGPDICSPLIGDCFEPTPTPTPTLTPEPTVQPTPTPEPTSEPTTQPTPTAEPTIEPTVQPTPTPNPENYATWTNGVMTGTFTEVGSESGSSYILWDSIEDGSLSGEPRHIRLRIEKNDFELIKDKLTSDLVLNKSLFPDNLAKRDTIVIELSNSETIFLYPYAENSENLIAALQGSFPGQKVGLTDKGLVYIITQESFLYGYLDYYVVKTLENETNQFKFTFVKEENGYSLYEITFPSGVKQNMYVFSQGMVNMEK